MKNKHTNTLYLLSFSLALILLIPFSSISQAPIKPVVQFGHPGKRISALAISPDGKTVASTDGQFLKLWDVETGMEFNSYKIGDSPMVFPLPSDVWFSSDGKFVHCLNFIEIDSFLVSNHIIKKSLSKKEQGKIRLKRINRYFNNTNSDQTDSSSTTNNAKDSTILTIDPVQLKKNSKKLFKTPTLMSPDNSVTVIIKNKCIKLRLNNRFLFKKRKIKNKKISPRFFNLPFGSKVQLSNDNKYLVVDTLIYSLEKRRKRYKLSPTRENMILDDFIISLDSKKIIFYGSPKFSNSLSSNQLAVIYQDILNLPTSKQIGNAIIICDIESRKIEKIIKASAVSCTFLSKQKNLLIIGHSNNQINIIDLNKGELLKTISLPLNNKEWNGVRSVNIDRDKNILLASCTNQAGTADIFLYDLKNHNLITSLGGNVPPVKLDLDNKNSDSLILKEYDPIATPFLFDSKEDFISYRMLDLIDGEIPHAFPSQDSILFNQQLDHYILLNKENNNLKVFRAENNEFLYSLESSKSTFLQIYYSPNDQWIAGLTKDKLSIWNAKTGLLHHVFKEKKHNFYSLFFDPSSNFIGVSCNNKSMYIFSLESKKIVWHKKPSLVNKILNGITTTSKSITNQCKKLPLIRQKFEDLIPLEQDYNNESHSNRLKRELNKIISQKKVNSLKKKSRSTKLITSTFNTIKTISRYSSLFYNRYEKIEISPSGKYAALWKDDYSSLQILNLRSRKKIRSIIDFKTKKRLTLFNLLFQKSVSASSNQSIPNLSYILIKNLFKITPLDQRTIILSDWSKLAILPSPKTTFDSLSNRLFPIGKKKRQKAKLIKSSISIKHLNKKDKKKDFILKNSRGFSSSIASHPTEPIIAASNDSKNLIRLWNANTGEVIKTFEGHSGQVIFGPNGKTLVSNGWDRQVKVWDIEKEKELYSFIAIKGENEYILMLPNGYYATSRKDTKALGFVQGRKVHPFDQFDLLFQRRDLLLGEFQRSIKDSLRLEKNIALQKAYKQAHLKRLTIMGLDSADLSMTLNLPQVAIGELPNTTYQDSIKLSVQASEEKHKLSSIHVLVNGVPALPELFCPLKNQQIQTIDTSFQIALSQGENNIQVFAINSAGARSLKAYKQVRNSIFKEKANYHLVLMGTSTFRDSSLNLKYPEIDLEKVESFFRQNKPNLQVYSLKGKDYTRENFEELTNKLRQTNVNDTIIFMVATHGILDEKYNYHLTTFETDTSHISETSISYSFLEHQLAHIPARQKLLLLDACHAGEVDTTNLKVGKITPEENITFRATPSTGWDRLETKSSFDFMKELFVDLRGNTGMTIIGSARSGEYALEGDGWQSSVFTYSLIKGLKEGIANKNSDDKILISELQNYLTSSVLRLTNNQQQPIHRTENIFNNWKIINARKSVTSSRR